MSLAKKSITGFIWMGSSSAIRSVIQLLVTIILARILSPSDFGIVAAAMVIVLFIELIYELGVGQAIVQEDKLENEVISASFYFSVLLGVLMAVLLILTSGFIESIYRIEGLAPVLQVLAWLFPIKTVGLVSYSVLQRNLEFKSIAGLDSLSYLVGYGGLGVILAYQDFGLWALVYAQIAQAVIYTTMLLIRQPQKFYGKADWNGFKSLLQLGMRFTLNNVLNFIARKADYFIVGRFLGAESLGFYSRSYSIMNVPNNIAGKAMGNVLFTGFSRIAGDNEKSKSGLIRSYQGLFLFLPFLSAFFSIYADQIVLILLGEKWFFSAEPLKYLSIAMTFRVGYKIGASYLKGNRLIGTLNLAQLIYLTMILTSTFIGKEWGINGVAIGIGLAIFLNFVFITGSAMKHVKLSFVDLFYETRVSLLASVAIISIVLAGKSFVYDFLEYGVLWNFLVSVSVTGFPIMSLYLVMRMLKWDKIVLKWLVD